MEENVILKDEDVLWSGRPNINVMFNANDIFLIPMDIAHTIFASILSVGILYFAIHQTSDSLLVRIVSILLLLPFDIMSYNLGIGRHINKRRWKKRIRYYITRDRIIILSERPEETSMIEIKDIKSIKKYERKSGVGSIKIYPKKKIWFAGLENTGLKEFVVFWWNEIPSFFDIDNVSEAYNILCEQEKLYK